MLNKMTFIMSSYYMCLGKVAINHNSPLFRVFFIVIALFYFKEKMLHIFLTLIFTYLPTNTHTNKACTDVFSFLNLLLITKVNVLRGKKKKLRFRKVKKEENSFNHPKIDTSIIFPYWLKWYSIFNFVSWLTS